MFILFQVFFFFENNDKIYIVYINHNIVYININGILRSKS